MKTNKELKDRVDALVQPPEDKSLIDSAIKTLEEKINQINDWCSKNFTTPELSKRISEHQTAIKVLNKFKEIQNEDIDWSVLEDSDLFKKLDKWLEY